MSGNEDTIMTMFDRRSFLEDLADDRTRGMLRGIAENGLAAGEPQALLWLSVINLYEIGRRTAACDVVEAMHTVLDRLSLQVSVVLN